MNPLLTVIYAFIGVLMLGVILDWFDRKAVRLDRGALMPNRPWLWVKRKGHDDTGCEFEYYVFVLRLPSYAWAYRINTDDYGWMQNAIFWYSRKPNSNSITNPPAGFSIHQLMPRG